jgi:hypothetical protein
MNSKWFLRRIPFLAGVTLNRSVILESFGRAYAESAR